RFLGVAGIEMAFDALVKTQLPLVEWSGYRAAYLVDAKGGVVVHTGAQDYSDARKDMRRGDQRIELEPLPWPEVTRALASDQPGGSVTVGGGRVAWARLSQLGWSYVVLSDELP